MRPTLNDLVASTSRHDEETSSLFAARWSRVGHLFRSPVTNGVLNFDPQTFSLTDSAGSSYPIWNGIPLLVPDLGDMITDHFQWARDADDGEGVLDKGRDHVLHVMQAGDAIRLFVLALPFEVLAAQPVDAAPPVPSQFDVSGCLVEHEGKLLLRAGDGWLEVTSFELLHRYYNHAAQQSEIETIRDARSLRSRILLSPPWFALAAKIPNGKLYRLYESYTFLPRPEWLSNDLRNVTHTASDDFRAGRPGARLKGIEVRDRNIDFFARLLAVGGVDIRSRPVLNVQSSGGYLMEGLIAHGCPMVIGGDQRILAFPALIGQGEREFYVAADPLQWCHAPGEFCAAIYHNAFEFASERSDSTLIKCLENLSASVGRQGLVYLSFETNLTGVAEAESRNRTLANILELFAAAKLGAVRYARFGNRQSFVLARVGELAAPREAYRLFERAQRVRAVRRYLQCEPEDEEALREQFLAIGSMASEIALRLTENKSKDLTLVGSGIVAYQLKRMFECFFPGFNVSSRPPERSVARKGWRDILSAGMQRPKPAPASVLSVLVDDRAFADPAFDPERGLTSLVAEPTGADDLPFLYFSGEADVNHPRHMAPYYFNGYLGLLGVTRDDKSEFVDWERKTRIAGG